MTQGMRKGLKDGTTIGLAASLLGLMYSLAALEAGLRPLETVFYSAIVYSAAVQFAALGTENALPAILTMLSGCVFISSRNILMSLDMARESRGRLWELLSMAGLVDAAWAMSRGATREDFWGYFYGQAIAIYILWMIGAVAGVIVPVPDHPAVSAAFAATPVVFFSLMISLIWRNGTNKLPHLATMVLTVLAAKLVGLPATFAALAGASVAAVTFVLLLPMDQTEEEGKE